MRRLIVLAVIVTALSALSISTTSADHPSGPAGFWRFDEGAGLTATDSAHANDGALNNGPTYDSINVAPVATSTHSLHFDGVDDYVEVPDAPELDVDNITVSSWVRLDSAPTATMNVLRKGPFNDRVFGLDIQPTDRARAFVVLGATGGPAIIANGTTALSTGVWYHLAMSYDGTNVRVYVNGVLEGTSSAAAGTISDNAQSVRIGGQNAAHNGGPLPLHGNLDEVQLYSRALSQAELDILAGNTPALVVDDDGEVGFGSFECDGVGVPAFTTIQDAEDAASAGDTIQVCPGSYDGATIDTADLTLVGPQTGIDPRAGGCAAPADEAVVTRINTSGRNCVSICRPAS